MSLEEANSLSTNVRKDMHNFNYWLGSARAATSMWYVSYYGGDGSMYTDYLYHTFGIHPVIIVSTSAL